MASAILLPLERLGLATTPPGSLVLTGIFPLSTDRLGFVPWHKAPLIYTRRFVDLRDAIRHKGVVSSAFVLQELQYDLALGPVDGSSEVIFFYKFCPNHLNGGIDEDRAPAKRSLLRWPCPLPSDRAIPVLWQNLESNV